MQADPEGIYPGLQMQADRSAVGLELAAHVRHENLSAENIWLESVQMHLVFRELGRVPTGHCLHTPYLA